MDSEPELPDDVDAVSMEGMRGHVALEHVTFGYDPEKVLMVGDAPGDCDAAEKTGVWYFPILVNWEEESWTELREAALDLFRAGSYGSIQADKKQVFVENLGG